LVRTPDPYPDQSMFWPYFLLIYNHFSVFAHACSVSVYLKLNILILLFNCFLFLFIRIFIFKTNYCF
jgi:hypothetical protein